MVVRLHALGVGGDKIKITYSGLVGQVATRRFSVTVSPSATPQVVAALMAGGASLAPVVYDLFDRETAYEAAIEIATRDAQARARAIAEAGHITLGTLAQVRVGLNDVATHQNVRDAKSIAIDDRADPVKVYATVTITYLVRQ